jgi:hypothetical protein
MVVCQAVRAVTRGALALHARIAARLKLLQPWAGMATMVPLSWPGCCTASAAVPAAFVMPLPESIALPLSDRAPSCMQCVNKTVVFVASSPDAPLRGMSSDAVCAFRLGVC